MDDNVYKPPESALNAELEPSEFYIVSNKKLLLLFFVTFGFYYLYWFYKHWALYKVKNNESILPILRAIFSIFFTHSLFKLFAMRARENEPNYQWSATFTATVYVIFTVLANIGDRLSDSSAMPAYFALVPAVLLPIRGWAIYKAQQVANFACNDPDGAQNTTLSVANILWCIAGTLLWLLLTIGMYEIVFGIPI